MTLIDYDTHTADKEIVTTDTIINWLKDQVEQKNQIPPSIWLDAAAKLTVLMGDETDLLFTLQQAVRKQQVELLKAPKMTVARAKLEVEATDQYREMKRQEAKIEAITEFIRISKLQARMRDNEYRLQ